MAKTLQEKGLLARLFTPKILLLVCVTITGGLLFGYCIGYVAVYTTLDIGSRSCDRATSETACLSMSHTVDCLWENDKCLYVDTYPEYQCQNFIGDNAESTCKNTKYCYWDYAASKCLHEGGMNSAELGIYAGAMTLGAAVGSFAAGPLAGKFGRKWCIVAAGCIGVVGSIIHHIGRATDVYALYVVGRLLVGVASGMACVLSPMYIEEMAPDDMRGVIGTMFQGAITSGILLSAFVGIIALPRDMAVKQNYEARLQGHNAVQTLFCAFYVVVGVVIPESKKYLQIRQLEKMEGKEAITEDHGELPDDKRYSIFELFDSLAVATIMCLVMQFTGINAIMNYAPKITNQLGLEPMLGNFIIMLWNCLTSFAAPPVSSRVPLRIMFITAVGIAFISLVIVGIPTYPGVTTQAVRQGLGMFGIFLFILVFEIGMGPPFYVLCMQLFPYTFRNKGCAYSNGVAFIFNLIINVFYPIVSTAISGGPSGNQNYGMAWCFYFFAFCAFISFIVCLKWLTPFYDTKRGHKALEDCAARRGTKTNQNEGASSSEEEAPRNTQPLKGNE